MRENPEPGTLNAALAQVQMACPVAFVATMAALDVLVPSSSIGDGAADLAARLAADHAAHRFRSQRHGRIGAQQHRALEAASKAA